MTRAETMVPRTRARSRLIKILAAILVTLLALLVIYGLWTVFENTLTPGALDQGPPRLVSAFP